MLDRAITVLALGLLLMIVDLATLLAGRVDQLTAATVFGLDLVAVGVAGVLTIIGLAESREVIKVEA
jgi:hypothetical protein